MKYVLVIPDGTADEPQPALADKTPLQAATVPNMDRVATLGRAGQADHVPASMPSGSDVGTMSLFGYNPLTDHTGRAPIEAAAQGIELADGDWAIRCNLVSIVDDVMKSFTAGQIPGDIGTELIELLQKESCGDGHWKFVPGVSYRNLAIWRSHGSDAPFSAETRTIPPHDITDRTVTEWLPQGPGSEDMLQWMTRSQSLFADHPANMARQQNDEWPATQVWLWGEGRRPALQPFMEKYGKTAAVITAVDLLRGLGRLLGWDVIEVPGATGYLDTDYRAKGEYGIRTLADKDFVVIHVEATDEASHEGDVEAKIEALQQIDQHIVGPVLDHLQSEHADGWRMLICPDHPTFLRTRTHSHGYVPFVMAGTGIEADSTTTYDENSSALAGFTLDEGFRLMSEFFRT